MKNRGFTLVELMIVVTVLAILAAVAVPSYREYVQQTRRADAKLAIHQVSNRQEARFSNFMSYSQSLTSLGYSASSPDGHYVISMVSVNLDGTPGYTVITSAVGAQVDDIDCATLRQDSVGGRRSNDKGGSVSTSECW